MSPRAFATIGVFVLAFVPFLPALGADWVDWDDTHLFMKNDGWRGLAPSNIAWVFSHAPMGHYQPVTWLTLSLDYVLWGLYAPGYHFTSLVIHALVAVLLFHLARALIRACGGDTNALWIPAAVAVLWAVNPMRVESVAWITERRDLVCGVFYLATLILYLRMAEDPAHRTRWFALALAAHALSLLSKAWGIAMPAVLIALDVWVLRRFETPESRRRALVEKVPFAVLSLCGALIASFTVREAALTIRDHPLDERVLQAFYGLFFYPRKTLLPIALSPFYPIDRRLTLSDPMILASVVAVVSVTVALIVFRARARLLLAGWGAYVVAVSPVLGFYQSGIQLVADRYAYLSTIMLFLPVCAWPMLWRSRRWIGVAAMAGVIVAWGALTWRQTQHWRSTTALWTHAVAVSPENYVARVELAKSYLQSGRHRDAIAECEAAVAVAPRYAEGWSCRGVARSGLRDFEGALADYDRALALNPRFADALTGRALAKLGLHDIEGALADLDEALKINPAQVQARTARARIREELGQLPEAADDCVKLLELAPPDWPGRAAARSYLVRLQQRIHQQNPR